MFSFRFLVLLFLVALGCLDAAGQTRSKSLAQALFNSISEGSADLISSSSPGLSLGDANNVQDEFVRLELVSKVIGGYKAGFTSSEAQEKWAVTTPVSGVLFSQGELRGSPVIDTADYQKLFIEMEIGFVLAKEIVEPIDSIESLRKYIRYVVPVIELPDLPFNSLKSLTAVDLVASNMASKNWLVGQASDVRALPNQIRAMLYQNGELVDSGSATIVSRLEALLWLVNDRLRRGWPLKAGSTLITGALGKINPASRACYRVDYGGFSQPISFQVTNSNENGFNEDSCLSAR